MEGFVWGGSSMSKWFDTRFRWKVGEGDKARFWLDNWAGEESFVEVSKAIYIWFGSGEGPCSEWEKYQFEELESILENVKLKERYK